MPAQELSKPVCFGVFDGMGGEQYGEYAAFIAAGTFSNVSNSRLPLFGKKQRKKQEKEHDRNPRELLREACLTANDSICRMASEHNGTRSGTTVAALYFHKTNVWVCNVGDSKVYLLNADEFKQISVDHTNQDSLLRQGITGRRPALTQHLGIHPDEMLIEPSLSNAELKAGDLYLICSDGLTDMLSDKEITTVAANGKSVKERVLQLTEDALNRGGRDNVTVILCDISG